MAIYSNETVFCAKYLVSRGITTAEELKDASESISSTDFVLVPQKRDFFTELAEKLRNMWPSGNKVITMKNGTIREYPWRDSVKNLSVRLETMWRSRQLEDKYTMEDCLTAARRYLNTFENNVTYMQTLKYFILKQDTIFDTELGKMRVTEKSTFADYLVDDTNSLFKEELSDALEELQNYNSDNLI